MHKQIYRLVVLFVIFSSLFFTGCASTPKGETSEEKVSTLPWNTPQKWEKSVPLGGAAY